MATEWIGWTSSVVLIFALSAQVRADWKSGSKRGASSWLYFGQLFAEAGFIAYSYLVNNWVFVVTNTLLFLLSVAGIIIQGKKGNP